MSEAASMTDGDALFAAILANPDDDTPRLVYADWLQENDEPVLCPNCEGKVFAWLSSEADRAKWKNPTATIGIAEWECRVCHGSGRVPGECADRAELIRVQCELSPFIRPDNPLITDGLDWHTANRVNSLLGRKRELLAAHPEWSRCACDWCGGTGQERVADAAGDMDDYLCRMCDGTGDLFRYNNAARPSAEVSRELTWDRGFIGGVELLSDECWREEDVACVRCKGSGEVPSYTGMYRLGTQACPNCQQRRTIRATVPTPLLLALLRRVPTLRRVVPTDRESYTFSGSHYWSSETWGDVQNSIPDGVFSLLQGFDPALSSDNTSMRGYPTRELAADALALAIPRWAREVGGGGRFPAGVG